MNLKIGMPVDEVRELIKSDGEIREQDMKNGYYWLRGRFEIFEESVPMSLCFKDGLLWMMEIMPQYNLDVERAPFEVLQIDRKCCREWLKTHKKQLPEGATVFEDRLTPRVGIVIR